MHACSVRHSGSSPRERGTRRGRTGECGRRWFIPAGAGNAPFMTMRRRPLAVHPRGSGERRYRTTMRGPDCGSSPRERGTPTARRPSGIHRRFIPAGAGNAVRRSWPWHRAPVHPRGSGERPGAGSVRASTSGSSPRERGTLAPPRPQYRALRFIPAGAGNAWTRAHGSGWCPVHPRGSGERPDRRAPAGAGPRFIPAGAGNATSATRSSRPTSVHPRGSGERAAGLVA